MEVNKMEESFDKLFKSLNGDTFLIGNSIKIKYNGLGETIIHAGGSVNLLPLFEMVSTNKSFTYSYLLGEVYKRLVKVRKYLGLNEKTLHFMLSFNLPPVYLIEDDQKYLDQTFMGLSRLNMYIINEPVGHFDISPLGVTFEVNDEGTISFNFNFFIKGGEIEMRNGEWITFPTHKDNDYIVEEYIKFNLHSEEIETIVDTLTGRILHDEDDINSVNVFLNPEF